MRKRSSKGLFQNSDFIQTITLYAKIPKSFQNVFIIIVGRGIPIAYFKVFCG